MKHLTIATWNVLADDYVAADLYPKSPTSLLLPGARDSAIVEDLLAMVDRLEVDAVCLQEVHGSLRKALESGVLPSGWRVLGSRDGGLTREQCLVLLGGRWSLRNHEIHSYARAPDHLAQRLVLQNGASTVALYNTHLQWAPDDGRLTGAQANELASWVDREDVPTLVAGDLNSPTDSLALRHLVGVGLTDLHPDESLRTADFDQTGPVRLDYILVREVCAQALPATEVVVDGIEPLPGWRCPSDHLPLAARLFVSSRPDPGRW